MDDKHNFGLVLLPTAFLRALNQVEERVQREQTPYRKGYGEDPEAR